MRLQKLLTAASIFLAAASLHADTFQYYPVSSTLTSGGAVDGSVNGTLTYSTSNVFRSSFAFTVDLNGTSTVYDLFLTNENISPDFTSLIFDTTPDFGGAYNEVALLTQSGFGNGPVCTLNAPCDPAGDDSYFYSFNGSTGQRSDFDTPLAATPEPSTFALLGTGLLGIGSFLRRGRTPVKPPSVSVSPSYIMRNRSRISR